MNATSLTPEEYDKYARSVGARVCEHLDGYVVLGFHPITGQAIIIADDNGCQRTRCALNNLLQIAMIQGNNTALNPKPPPEDGQSFTTNPPGS